MPLARHGKVDDVGFEVCSNAVRFQQRFNQLGVGWLLRELSRCDLDRTISFILENCSRMSREGLRYAIEKMNHHVRLSLLRGNIPVLDDPKQPMTLDLSSFNNC